MSLLPNPWILLAFVVALVGAYFKGCNDGADLAEGQQAREERIVATALDAAQRGTAKAIAGIEIKNVTIKQRVETEIREKPVYIGCRHTPDGLRLVNAALTGGAEPAGDRELPRLDATQ